jgi:hypothetical protein
MPKNEVGYLFCSVTLLFAAILNAIIFGDIAGLVLSLSRDSTMIQEITDGNNAVMRAVDIEEEVQDQIRLFF